MFNSLALQDTILETDEDEVLTISNEALFEAAADLDVTYQDFATLEQLGDTLDDLEHLHAVFEQHGVTESLLAFTNRDKLLSTVMPQFDACEALGGNVAVDAAETIAAQEALVEKIKEMGAEWFKKAWDAVVSLSDKVVALAKAAWERVESATKWAAGKVYNAAKATAEVVKAHPITSALAAVALAVGAGAIIMSVWEIPLPVTAEQLVTWKTAVTGKLKAGFKGAVAVGKKGAEVAGTGIEAVKEGTATALGYTKEKFTAVTDGAKAAFAEGGSMNRLGAAIKEHSTTAFNAAKEAAGKAGTASLSFARTALRFLMSSSMSAIRWVASRGMAILTSVFGVFKGLFGTKEEVEGYVSDASMARRTAAAAAARAAASHSG